MSNAGSALFFSFALNCLLCCQCLLLNTNGNSQPLFSTLRSPRPKPFVWPLFSLLNKAKCGCYYYPHFSWKETQRRREVKCAAQSSSASGWWWLSLAFSAGLPETRELLMCPRGPQSSQDRTSHNKHLLRECLRFSTSWISHLGASLTFIVSRHSNLTIRRLSLPMIKERYASIYMMYVYINIHFPKLVVFFLWWNWSN